MKLKDLAHAHLQAKLAELGELRELLYKRLRYYANNLQSLYDEIKPTLPKTADAIAAQAHHPSSVLTTTYRGKEWIFGSVAVPERNARDVMVNITYVAIPSNHPRAAELLSSLTAAKQAQEKFSENNDRLYDIRIGREDLHVLDDHQDEYEKAQ